MSCAPDSPPSGSGFAAPPHQVPPLEPPRPLLARVGQRGVPLAQLGRDVPSWLVSLVTHLTVLLCLASLVLPIGRASRLETLTLSLSDQRDAAIEPFPHVVEMATSPEMVGGEDPPEEAPKGGGSSLEEQVQPTTPDVQESDQATEGAVPIDAAEAEAETDEESVGVPQVPQTPAVDLEQVLANAVGSSLWSPPQSVGVRTTMSRSGGRPAF